jgi:hypothetical protein
MSREQADLIFKDIFDKFGDLDGTGGIGMMFQSMSMGGASMRGESNNGFGHFFPSGIGFGSSFPAAYRGRNAHPRSRSRRTHRRSHQPYVVPNGAAVVIHGLSRSSEHNGRIGQVQSWDPGKGRYKLELKAENETVDQNLWVRPQNMTQLLGAVQINGLRSKPELNGKTGEIFNYDEVKRRYMVLVDGAAVALQPANCILSVGTCVTLDGLSTVEFNGQKARILSVDRTAGRYTVACERRRQLKIRYDNVKC